MPSPSALSICSNAARGSRAAGTAAPGVRGWKWSATSQLRQGRRSCSQTCRTARTARSSSGVISTSSVQRARRYSSSCCSNVTGEALEEEKQWDTDEHGLQLIYTDQTKDQSL